MLDTVNTTNHWLVISNLHNDKLSKHYYHICGDKILNFEQIYIRITQLDDTQICEYFYFVIFAANDGLQLCVYFISYTTHTGCPQLMCFIVGEFHKQNIT